MKANEIREMTVEELNRKESDLKAELFNLRFRMATGQLENPMKIGEIKKDLARVKTILKEKEVKAQ